MKIIKTRYMQVSIKWTCPRCKTVCQIELDDCLEVYRLFRGLGYEFYCPTCSKAKFFRKEDFFKEIPNP